MLKTLQVLILSSFLFGGALAEDASLVVNKKFKQVIHFGGILSLFRKDRDIKRTWLEIKPGSGTVLIHSISLDGGNCSFDSVALPTTVAFNQQLEIKPNCNVAEAVIRTDRGTYEFQFNNAVK